MPDRRVALVVVVGVVVVTLAGVAAGFLSFFERYDEVVDHGVGARARRNRYLAAELFLRRVHGDPVASHASWVALGELDMLGPQATLIVTDESLVLSDSQVERLLAWVRGGGHLIVGAARGPADEREGPLLERFGVSRLSAALQADEESATDEGDPERDEADPGAAGDSRSVSESLREYNEKLEEARRAGEAKAGAEDDGAKDGEKSGASAIPSDEITRLDFSGEDSALELHFSRRAFLHHAAFDVEETEEGANEEDAAAEPETDGDPASEAPQPSSWAGSDAGVHLIQFDVGDGLLTILSDASIWETEKIAELDHAHLLRLLTSDDGGVVLLYGRDVMSANQWLWRNARAPLLAGALTLLCALWLRGRRFGPIRADPPPGSRSLAEQLDGAAQYLWWNGHCDVLVDAMRTEVDGTAESRALSGEVPTGEQEFILLARRLQEIRNAR